MGFHVKLNLAVAANFVSQWVNGILCTFFKPQQLRTKEFLKEI